MATIATARNPAETSSIERTPTSVTKPAVSAGPASAPTVPPAAMKPYSRFACAVSNRSAMKLQNTLIANRLNTLTQTKNARATASACAPWPASNSSQNPPRLATKNAYSQGSRRRRGNVRVSQPNTGATTSMVTNTPRKSSCSFACPTWIAISSRIGRST